MLKYIVRRVLQMVPVFLGVTILLFVLTVVIPGDPIAMRMGERNMTDAQRASIRKALGLDKPLYQQYGDYLVRLSKGDLGESSRARRPVLSIFADLYPNTIRLALAAIVIEIIIGIGAGIISAIKRYSFMDVLVTLSTSILVSLPVFWLGLMMQLLFGIKFKEWGLPYLPVVNMTSDQFPPWAHMIMPSIVLASVSTAYVARIMRSQLLEVMNQDYIRTAQAKGLSPSAVIWKHGLKNAMIPVVTFIGLDLGAMMSGAILTETVFNWPGIGYMVYQSILQRDWPVVMGGVIIIVFVVMIINLLVDISYAFLDPRIRYGAESS